VCTYDGGKKVKGRKRHFAVDTEGHVLTSVVHPANNQDPLALLIELIYNVSAKETPHMRDTRSIHVRKARSSDAQAISNLLHETGYLRFINEETNEQTEARICAGIATLAASSEHVLLVATYEDDVAQGYGAVHFYANLLIGNEGYISELYLHPLATNQGIGSRLLNALVNEAHARQCRRLRLTNWRTRESYQRHFYAKQGWIENIDAAEFVLLL